MNEHSTSHLQSKNQKMCVPIPVIVFKMWPYYSHYRRENATPSSSTSILASYKEVPSPSPGAKESREFINHQRKISWLVNKFS